MKRITLILSIVVIIVIGYVAVGMVAESQNPERYKQIPSKPVPPKVITPVEVETALNEWRVDQGLPTFKTDNPVLDEAAQARAESMCAANDWSHDKAWQVLDQYYNYEIASENIHYDFLQENQAENAIYGWSNSPGHLKTMLAEHTEASIGVKYCPGYQGDPNSVLIVNYFGVPR